MEPIKIKASAVAEDLQLTFKQRMNPQFDWEEVNSKPAERRLKKKLRYVREQVEKKKKGVGDFDEGVESDGLPENKTQEIIELNQSSSEDEEAGALQEDVS